MLAADPASAYVGERVRLQRKPRRPISRRIAFPEATFSKMPMNSSASGTFEVKMAPEAQDEVPAGVPLGRMSLDKQFHGDLEGTSTGQMLTAMTAVRGSAGYVAIERVSGTLHDRRGTFVLQHSGIMTRGAPQLVITVVPDSGTGELAGLAGTMKIDVADGNHSYALNYVLAPPSREEGSE